MNDLRIAVPVILLCVALPSHSGDWSRWRGPYNTGMAIGEAPLRWSATQNIKWTAEIPGRGHSPPVVWGDKIFVTTAVPTGAASEPDGSDRAPGRRGSGGGGGAGIEHKLLVMAFDKNSGRKLWAHSPLTFTPHEGYHRRYGSFASNSPVTDGERLYAFFGSRGVFAYDLDGNLQWKKDYGVQMRMVLSFGEGIAPALGGNTLVLVFDHEGQSFISALDARTGKELWRRDRDEISNWAQPLITEFKGRTEVIVAAPTKIRSYDLSTGELIWECAGLGRNTIPAVVRDGDIVFAMSGFRNPNLLAIRLGGAGDLTGSDHVVWTNQRGNSYTASPVIHDGILYFVTDNGLLSALDAKTGKPYYQQRRLPNPYSIKASPVGAAGKLYIATEQGDVVVVKMGPHYEVLATNTIQDEFFIASPVIVDGDIFLRGRNTLYAIGD